MVTKPTLHPYNLQIGDLCRRIDVPVRQVSYVLEEGYLPEGVEQRPGRGNGRQLRIEQAYWLAIVLKLRESGIKTQAAAELADYAKRGLSKVGVTMGWDKTSSHSKAS